MKKLFIILTPRTDIGYGIRRSAAADDLFRLAVSAFGGVLIPMSVLGLTAVIFLCTAQLCADERTIVYAEDKVRFTADHVEFDRETNTLYGRGNFHLIQGETELYANEAHINLSTKEVVARGRVRLYDQETELYGEEVHYNMHTKKGKIIGGVVYQRPWIIYGPSMEKVNEKKTIAYHARITSCDRTPPHYYLSTSKVFVYLDEYLFAINTTMRVDGVPIFYLPVFFKSLGERSFSLDVRPGYSKREGITVKTTLGIPVGPYLYGRLLYDYFQIKGNGFGTEWDYFNENTIKGTLYAYHIKERDTLRERWNIRGSHWQRLNKFLVMQGNLEFQSDENFNNTYFKEAYERVTQKRISDLAFTASTKKTTTRILFRRNERYDGIKDKFVVENLTAPSINFTTSRVEIGRTRLYYTVSGALNHTFSKTDDFYRKSGNTGLSLTKTVRITRNTVFTPRIQYNERWRDRRTEDDLRDLFNGSYTTNAALRQRITRLVDVDLGHVYTVRTLNNSIKTDAQAQDKGIERNHGSIGTYYRLGRRATLKVLSGYNFHKVKGEVVETYKSKVDNIFSELRVRATHNIIVSLRDTYDVYPRTNVGFSGDIRLWKILTNWSYLKVNKGKINIYHKLLFNFTKKTHIDYGVRYIASGPSRLNYDQVEFTEHSLSVVRDMHCFEFRATYTKRGEGSEEVLFSLQLKADMQRKKRLFDRFKEKEFYPWRT